MPFLIPKRDFWALALPLVAAALAWLSWQISLDFGQKKAETLWLYQTMPAVYLITGLSVFAFLVPSLIFGSQSSKIEILFVGLACYAIALLGFFVAKTSLYQVHLGLFPRTGWHKGYLIGKLFLVLILVSWVFFSLKQRFLFQSSRVHLLCLIFALISVIPASLISLEWGLNWTEGQRFVHAVQMGYPFFWTPLFLGLLSYCMIKKLI